MNDVTIAPSRLPIAPAIAKEYDLNAASWRVLVESIFPAAKSIESVLMALAYCKARNLDIYKRPVHIVPMWDSKKRAFVETVWEGIASIRTTASRTGAYAGIDAVEYGPTIRHEFTGERDIWEKGQKTGTETVKRVVEYPEWASVVVYRMIGNQRCAFHAKVFWREAYATLGKMEVPNEMWGRRPFGQIDKCVEAAGLRKAFPEELGNTLSADEMEGMTIEGSVVADVPAITPPKPPAKTPPKKDTKPDMTGTSGKTPPKPPAKKEEVRHDEETGEVIEGEVVDDGPTPGDLLTALDEELGECSTPDEIAEVWDSHDIEAKLQGVTGGEQFITVAIGMRRKHLRRVP